MARAFASASARYHWTSCLTGTEYDPSALSDRCPVVMAGWGARADEVPEVTDGRYRTRLTTAGADPVTQHPQPARADVPNLRLAAQVVG